MPVISPLRITRYCVGSSFLFKQSLKELDNQLGIGFEGQLGNIGFAFLNEKRIFGIIFHLKKWFRRSNIYDMILEHIVKILDGIKLLWIKLIRYSEFRKYLNGKFKAGIRILDDDFFPDYNQGGGDAHPNQGELPGRISA
mgnify:CR=1 FL=1